MKLRFIFPILFVFLIFSCNHEPEIDWSENNDRVFLENTCTDYFFNLTENFPTNSKGSCGYVAACSLFAYYDLNFDENLVEEKYQLRNKKSFGLKHINLSDVEALNNVEYYDFLKTNQDEYLMAKLIVSSNERFLTDSGNTILYAANSKSPMELYDGSESRFIDSDCEVQVVMNYYLHELMGFQSDYICAKQLPLNRDLIIQKIQEGVPVLAAVKNGRGTGHICIIYDYDEIEDELYAHLLMQPEYNESRLYNHIKLSSFYKKMKYPVYIEIKNQ